MNLNYIDKEIVVYNKSNISKWTQEITDNQTEITRQQGIVEEHQNKVNHYLEQIAILSIQLIQTASQAKSLRFGLDAIDPEQAPAATELSGLYTSVVFDELAISSANSKINALKARTAWLNEHIEKGNYFLKLLSQNPHEIVNSFIQHAQGLLDNFEENHPSNQSKLVRQCILEINQNTQQIIAKSLTDASPQDADKIKFHQLAGLYAKMLSLIEATGSDNDMEFAKYLVSVLGLTHIPINGDLPDDMQLNISSQEHYQQNNRAVTSEEQEKYEKQQYDDNYNGFVDRLNNIKPSSSKELNLVHEIGEKIASRINNEKNASNKETDSFDIKFATNILRTSNNLLDHPKSIPARDKLKKLADHEDKGKPSLLKKIGGSLLTLFGVAVIAASSIAIAASFGASTPLSLLGISLATTALTQGLSIAAGVTGVGMLGGMGLFANGMRKGFSKEIVQFADAEQKATNTNQLHNDELLPKKLAVA